MVWKGLVVSLVVVTVAGCSGKRVTMDRDHIIVDRLERAEAYYDMHPGFEKAFAFLRSSDLADLPPERYEIDGDNLFCTISNGPARTRDEAQLEAHKKYIDIQYVIGGTEEMGWRPTPTCVMSVAGYDKDKDIEFFRDAPVSWTELKPGSFVILFPEDAHAPLVGEGTIHKAVLKIAVEQ